MFDTVLTWQIDRRRKEQRPLSRLKRVRNIVCSAVGAPQGMVRGGCPRYSAQRRGKAWRGLARPVCQIRPVWSAVVYNGPTNAGSDGGGGGGVGGRSDTDTVPLTYPLCHQGCVTVSATTTWPVLPGSPYSFLHARTLGQRYRAVLIETKRFRSFCNFWKKLTPFKRSGVQQEKDGDSGSRLRSTFSCEAIERSMRLLKYR